MWTKVTLGLIVFLGLLMIVAVGSGNFTVVASAPPGAQEPHPAWLFGWIFVLFSAVIIVAVFAVRLVVKAVRWWRNR